MLENKLAIKQSKVNGNKPQSKHHPKPINGLTNGQLDI